MTAAIRTDVTFARLVYEHVEYPGDRSYTAWTPDRHMLHAWALMFSDWPKHRVVYIERCRLKSADPCTKRKEPIQPAPPHPMGDVSCEDCPPWGYPTDETRCMPCPRRGHPATFRSKNGT